MTLDELQEVCDDAHGSIHEAVVKLAVATVLANESIATPTALVLAKSTANRTFWESVADEVTNDVIDPLDAGQLWTRTKEALLGRGLLAGTIVEPQPSPERVAMLARLKAAAAKAKAGTTP